MQELIEKPSIEYTTERLRQIQREETENKTSSLEYFLTKLNFKFIAQGLNRRVFLSPDKKYVVKLELENRTSTQNKPEIEAYLNPYSRAKNYAIPLLDYDKEEYLWIIQAYGEQITQEEYEHFLNSVDFRFSDNHIANFGKYKGKVVLIDLGWE